MIRLLVSLSLVFVVGCKTRSAEPPEEGAAPDKSAAAPAVQQAPADQAAASTPPPGADPHAGSKMAEAAEKMKAIEAALMKAKAVTGPDHCTTAYKGVSTLMEEIKKSVPEASRPVPPEAAFKKMCKGLPKNVQQCMVIGYSMDHQEECQKVQSEMRDIHRKRIEALMEPDKGKAPAPAKAPAKPAS